MTDLTTAVRVLENNLKPATHFIEVCNTTEIRLIMLPIEHLEYELFNTSMCKMIHTIAIFKIRMKPQ